MTGPPAFKLFPDQSHRKQHCGTNFEAVAYDFKVSRTQLSNSKRTVALPVGRVLGELNSQVDGAY